MQRHTIVVTHNFQIELQSLVNHIYNNGNELERILRLDSLLQETFASMNSDKLFIVLEAKCT